VVLAPTPPPDVDVEAWLTSIELVAAWEPRSLCLTHFGRFEGVDEHLESTRAALRLSAERARDGDEDSFTNAVEDEIRSATSEDVAERYFQAAPPGQLWLGLERYWRKRAEAATR
jgi:hypothetical protein